MQNIAEEKIADRSGKKPSFWRRLLNRFSHPGRPAPNFNVENLEGRVVLGAGPTLTGVQLQGPLTSINAVVMTFNESLNPATAQTLLTYAFGRPPVGTPSDPGLSLSDFLPFRETGHVKPEVVRPRLIRFGKIIFTSAVYNDTAHTVTLTPIAPFRAQTWFRYLRLKGTGPNAIRDLAGIALNGGKDAVARWWRTPGKLYRYLDFAHDKVTFKLTGPGKMVVFRRFGKNSNPTIFIDGATSATVLTGTVTNPHVLNPQIDIAQLAGAENVSNNLLNNPSFNVQVTTP